MKRIALFAGAAAALAVALERSFASPRYRGPHSDHFDGDRFHNHQSGWQTEASFLKWQMNRQRGEWRDWVDAPPGPPPPDRVGDGKLRVTFINHATTLIQMDGVNILTDPIWSERCSPVSFAGPKRHRPPGIRFEDLPKIDVVLVSHNHYDHLDLPTLRRLRREHDPRIFTPLGNAAIIEGRRASRPQATGVSPVATGTNTPRQDAAALRARRPPSDSTGSNTPNQNATAPRATAELDWWQSAQHDAVTITAVPAQHFCARAISDRNRTLWGGFVISGPSGNVYFAGDTGWGKHFAEVRERFRDIRLALLPIGAYLPRWFMKPAHISPVEAVDAHLTLGAKTSVAIHFGTFDLGDDGELEPVENLRKAIAAKGNSDFVVLDFGEGRDVP